eukprot:GHVR01175211.1.p1 GENE.GHVR01175211.1~~GHVR01175211.1.p1  ORF type:complete len:247 (+),score=93.77 GHVR01175211.1:56-796(+)
MSDIVLECDTKIQNNLNNNEIKSNNLKSQEEKKKKLKLLTKEIIKETKCNIFKEWLISIQTELHKYPEIAYKEYKTSLIIKRILLSLSVSFTYGWGNQLKENNYNIYNNNNNNNNEKEESLLLFKPYEGCLIQYKEEEKILKEEGCLPYGTGIVADIGRGGPPFVLLRADMDGLPIQEDSGVPYTSLTPNFMHACGHDAHMAMLLGATRLLKERESELPGTVRIIFQPAEEGGAGAKRMIDVCVCV